jgi:SulP family sulfate permease
MSRLSSSLAAAAASVGGAGGASAATGPLPDLEQPLLPAGEEEEHTYMEHMLEPKPWPQLRLSSVSTRRLSPAMFSSPADELLTGRAGSGDSGTPSQQRSRQPVLARFSVRDGADVDADADQPLLSPRIGGFAPALQAAAAAYQPTAAGPFHNSLWDQQQQQPPGAASISAEDNAVPEAAGQGGAPGAAAVRPHKPAATAATPSSAAASSRYSRAAVAGCINAICSLPIMLSFASIIFRDPFFRPYLGNLVKLVFLVGAALSPCCAVLRCAVFCCAVMCCAVWLRSAVRCCVARCSTALHRC